MVTEIMGNGIGYERNHWVDTWYTARSCTKQEIIIISVKLMAQIKVHLLEYPGQLYDASTSAVVFSVTWNPSAGSETRVALSNLILEAQ